MLNFESLEKHNSDILIAEIAALLFNMGKTCVEFWKNYFPNIKGDFSDFENIGIITERNTYLKN